MRRIGIVCLIAVILTFTCGIDNPIFASEMKVDLNALINETQKTHTASDRMALVWWIPEVFWRVTFSQDNTMTPAQIEEFIKVLRPYTVLIVADGDLGAFGGVTWYPGSFLRENMFIIDNEGTRYKPLDDKNLDSDIKNFLGMMKPVFVNMLGPMGENMHFFLFPSKTTKGSDIVNAKKEGTFSVKLKEEIYKWKLPLSLLIPLKICPVDGEKLNGAWKFCPWHGVPLK